MKSFRFWPEAPPGADVARAYRPTVRAYLATAALYNFIICIAHPFYETGGAFLVLETLAVAAVITGIGFFLSLRRDPISLPRLELAAAAMNGIFLANVFAYQLLHFQASKLVYFVFLAMAFAIGAPTRRLSGISVAAAMGCMVYVARQAPPDQLEQYAFIGLAGAFTALGMSMLMRNAVLRELRARLASEALQAKAEVLAVAAQTASRAKSEFLATMSHEIRTPLNGVLGTAEAMGRGDLADDQRRRLALIQSSGQSLLEVLNAVLDISQIEAGRLELNPAPFRLERFADGMGQLYGGLAEDKGLTLSMTVAPEAAGWRQGDEARLRQVVSNLISNAIKFTDRGGVTVHFAGGPDQLTCSVVDTGVGIPSNRLPTVFERFVQLDGSPTRRSGGSGLGLAICRELLSLMGGHIVAESPAEGGARFAFTVPCPAVAAPTAEAGAEPQAASLDEGLRVLIVDDNETNRIVLSTMLGHLGVASGQARDGLEAIARWQDGGWDAILMDIHMPGMDGVRACREIRAREAAAGRPRTPVIAVTASVLSHETQAYLAAGLDGVVSKPIRTEQLLAALDSALSEEARRMAG